MKYFLLFVLICVSCSPNSHEDIRREAHGVCAQIVKDLRKVEKREELEKIESRLKKKFNKLVDLMIEARSLPHLEKIEIGEEGLLNELRRIYAIEGAREIIERAQRDALLRLDAFEIQLKKRQQKVQWNR